jgi:hypothetical protein
MPRLRMLRDAGIKTFKQLLDVIWTHGQRLISEFHMYVRHLPAARADSSGEIERGRRSKAQDAPWH